jgi:hypothetical protein
MRCHHHETEGECVPVVGLVMRAFHLPPFSGIQRWKVGIPFHRAVDDGEVQAINEAHGERFPIDLAAADDEGFGNSLARCAIANPVASESTTKAPGASYAVLRETTMFTRSRKGRNFGGMLS